MSVHSKKPTPAASQKIVKEKTVCSRSERFRGFAQKTSCAVGSPVAFAIAVSALVIWAAFGPATRFSDTWQLVVNTATTIVTFLMVFLIQNTQNRDAKALHLKLDELIHAVKGARNQLINLENLSEEELLEIEQRFKKISESATDETANKHETNLNS